MERLREPPKPPPDPPEELLKKWPKLRHSAWSGLGLGCLMRGLVEIARALRTYPWIVEVTRLRPVSILHPYAVEVYVRTGLRRVSRSPRRRLFAPKTARRGRCGWS
jgi:hypothetical protein